MATFSQAPQGSARIALFRVLAVAGLALYLTPTARAQEPSRAKGTARSATQTQSRTAKSRISPEEPRRVDAEPTKDENENPDADAKDEETTRDDDKKRESPPGLFGDPKRFTKLGGWGSVGGSMGQFGMARSALIMMPPVQEELKLTDAQKKKIREWMDGTRKRGEEMGKAMREQAGDPAQQEAMPLAARIFQFTRMIEQVGTMLRENETGLARILDRSQRARLTQIALQMEGIAAVTKPEVARAINLSPGQIQLIQQTLAQSKLMQMTTWIEQGARMSQRFRPRPEGPTNPDAEPNPNPNPNNGPNRGASRARGKEGAATPRRPEGRDAQTDDDDPLAEEKARAERANAMRKEFEAMRSRTDGIQERTVLQIAKILSRRQREKFEKLLGEPFDPAKVNTMGRPGDRERAAPGAAPSSSSAPGRGGPTRGQGSGLPPSNQGASR